MDVVQIDPARAEPPQRCFAGGDHVTAREAGVVGPGSRCAVHLRRDDEAVALAAQPAADDLFRAANRLERSTDRIHVGDVEEIDPGALRRIHDRTGFVLIGLQPERHRAQTNL